MVSNGLIPAGEDPRQIILTRLAICHDEAARLTRNVFNGPLNLLAPFLIRQRYVESASYDHSLRVRVDGSNHRLPLRDIEGVACGPLFVKGAENEEHIGRRLQSPIDEELMPIVERLCPHDDERPFMVVHRKPVCRFLEAYQSERKRARGKAREGISLGLAPPIALVIE